MKKNEQKEKIKCRRINRTWLIRLQLQMSLIVHENNCSCTNEPKAKQRTGF